MTGRTRGWGVKGYGYLGMYTFVFAYLSERDKHVPVWRLSLPAHAHTRTHTPAPAPPGVSICVRIVIDKRSVFTIVVPLPCVSPDVELISSRMRQVDYVTTTGA